MRFKALICDVFGCDVLLATLKAREMSGRVPITTYNKLPTICLNSNQQVVLLRQVFDQSLQA